MGFVSFLEDLEDLAGELLVGVRLTPHALRNGPSDLPGELVVPLAGGDLVIGGYPGALLGALGVGLGDRAQILEVRLGHGLGHRGRGHLSTPPSVVVASSSKHVRLATHRAQLNIRGL
jgi:hypothetical protein